MPPVARKKRRVMAWRNDLVSRNLSVASVRRKLSSLSSLFDYLCDRNALLGNAGDGFKRPMANNNEGNTPGPGRCPGKAAPRCSSADTLKGCGIAPFLPRCSITVSGAKNSAFCGCVTCRAAMASRTSYRGQARQNPVRTDASDGAAARK